MSRAIDYITAQQVRHPPWHGADRAKQLYALLEPDLPEELRAMYATGRLAVGEIGDALPNAYTRALRDGEHVVILNSGLMEFIYGVTRTLIGYNTTICSGVAQDPVLSRRELVNRIADVAKAWKAGKYFDGKAFRHPDFPLSDDLKRLAHGLSVNAELFALAHELGHVLIAGPPLPNTPMAPDQEEVTADQFGVLTLIGAAPRLGWRLVFAGMVLQIRIYALLERLGYQFDDRYPSPTLRLKMLKTGIRGRLIDEFNYAAISTMALAYDEVLEDVENAILRQPVLVRPTAERLQAKLFAITEEYVAGTLSLEEAGADAAASLEAAPEETIRTVAARLYDWFLAPTEAGAHDPTGGRRLQFGQTLQAFAFDLPEPARTVFRESGVWLKFGGGYRAT